MDDALFSEVDGTVFKLQKNNRWVQLADELDWEKLEKQSQAIYCSMSKFPFRMRFGCLLLQYYLGCSEVEILQQIAENPYFQYFIGGPISGEKSPVTKRMFTNFSRTIGISVEDVLLHDPVCQEILHFKLPELDSRVAKKIKELQNSLDYKDLQLRCTRNDLEKFDVKYSGLLDENERLLDKLAEYKNKAKMAQLSKVEVEPEETEDLMDISALTDEQKAVFDRALSGENLFVTGGAGTGKSYLLKRIIAHLVAKKKNVIVGAPTGMAALHIGGVTLHRLFGLPIGLVEDIHIHGGNITNLLGKAYDVIRKADVLVIDEISMCRADAFARIAAVVEYMKGAGHPMQVILCGDFFQLPPVVTTREKDYFRDVLHNEEGWAFLSPYWKALGISTCQLNKVIRQENPDFAHALNEVREGNSDGLGYICAKTYTNQGKGVMLCGKNRDAQAINERELNALMEPIHAFDAKVLKNEEELDADKEIRNITDPHIELCEGARVIITINDPSGLEEFHNGSMGNIIEIDDDVVMVRLDDGNVVTVPMFTYQVYDYKLEEDKDTKMVSLKRKVIFSFEQIPLRLGWAITIHKSQGQTYEHMMLNTNSLWPMDGLLYVGLSRVTTTAGLTLKGGNRYRGSLSRFLKASKSVKAFYKASAREQKAVNSLAGEEG